MGTATFTLPTTDQEVLTILDAAPAHLPTEGRVLHHRLTGERGTHHAQAVTISRLDQLAIHGLVTRTRSYLGKPGKFYSITDRGLAALHA